VINPSLSSRGDPSTDSVERQLVAEVLSTISSACTQEIRRHILSSSLPSLPDQSSSITGKHGASSYQKSSSEHKEGVNSPEDPLTSNLLLSVILGIIDGDDVIVIEHLSDVLRSLIEPDVSHRPHQPDHSNNGEASHSNPAYGSNSNGNSNHASSKQEMEKFLAAFYECYIHWLILPFSEPNDGALPRKSPAIHLDMIRSQIYRSQCNLEEKHSAIGASRRCLLELLTICVSRHAYRMKYFVMRSGLLAKLNRFLSSLNLPSSQPALRHLQVNVVKFWRAILTTKDEFYFRHIVKLDLLSPLLQALEKELMNLHQQRLAATIIASPSTKKISRFQESLIASAVVELLSFLGETSATLVVYAVEKFPNYPIFSIESRENSMEAHSSSFHQVASSFMEVFKQLRYKYEEIINPSSSSMAAHEHHHAADHEANRTNKKRNREFLEQGKEESYFESDDDDGEVDHSDYQLLSSDPSGSSSSMADPQQAAELSSQKSSTSSSSSKSLSKDSLQLLADFYADYESDDDIPFLPAETSPKSSASSSSSPSHSPRDDELAEKRRRIAKIRDLVDFGVSSSPSSSASTSPRSTSPTPTPHNHSSNNSNGHKHHDYIGNHDDFQPPLQLPPLRSKFDDADIDLTKDEFLKRAAKYSQSRSATSIVNSSKASSNDSSARISKSSSMSSFDNITSTTTAASPAAASESAVLADSSNTIATSTSTKQISFSLVKKK
jgi:hypothetical protein